MMKKLPWHEPKVLECITRLEKGLQVMVLIKDCPHILLKFAL